MRKPVIAGNWKMYKTTKDAVEMVSGLVPLVQSIQDVDIVVAPVFTVLGVVGTAIKGSNVKLAAQDCFWENEGAFTGEISPAMLTDVGCSHVIIGHSERRQYFGETDESVNKKTHAALQAGLTVILCIGETLAERETNKTFDVLKRQLSGGITGLRSEEMANIIVAYEPVWAIGTGKTASDAQAQEAHAFIRSTLAACLDQATADRTRILYGGSVKPENVRGLMAQPDIDGALVGGASLKADSFAQIAGFKA
jgi:triosephosphate isomerase